ncbi:MAG: hypothetical protein HQL94_00600 [Magnetococcales bacterium]|nr:hypothetical protein [Magnetococcales bacterium]
MTPPHPDLGLVVVIPCFNEPDLLSTLDSVAQCELPPCATECIVVINHPSDAPVEIQTNNQATLTAARSWVVGREDSRLVWHILDYSDLPPRQAGVGLARKIGMDLGLVRLLAAGKPKGVIVALDADCRVAGNYLVALYEHFQMYPLTPGCAIHFRHPLEGLTERPRYGIAAYELSLRYVVQGWRYCGLPNGFHTVGSAMAVRAEAYRKQGGMNRRQAGEDFYFLQKIMALGNFTALTTTTVFPSPRISHRVPFGTGRAMAEWMSRVTKDYLVWNPLVFEEPRHFFSLVETLYTSDDALAVAGSTFGRFLSSVDIVGRLCEMRGHTASSMAFRKRFFHWFDGFRFLKWAHWAAANGLGDRDVETAALTLLDWQGHSCPEGSSSVEGLLAIYDRLDRANE